MSTLKHQWLLQEYSNSKASETNVKPVNSDIKDSMGYFESLKSLVENKDSTELKHRLEDKEYQETIDFQTEDHGQSLLHISALQLDVECVKVLLEAGANPNIKDKLKRIPLHSSVSKGCRCQECLPLRLQCVELLINAGSDPNSEDVNRETPLYYTANNMYSPCAKLLLEKGADLYHWNDTTNVARLLAEFLPDVLISQLDKCVSYDPKDNLLLRLDLRLIIQAEEDLQIQRKMKIPKPETELLQSVLKARMGKELIVTHPVAEAFLHFKWLAVRRYFFMLRSFYFILLILYTYLMLHFYSAECTKKLTDHSERKNRTRIDPRDNFDTDINCTPNSTQRILGYVLYTSVIIMIISEVFKMAQKSKKYFSWNSTDYLWWILIFFWSVTLLPIFEIMPDFKWQLPLASVAVIFSWLINLLQLGRMPWFAIHVGLFVKVVKDFIKLLVTFATVLIAFAFGFCILFPTTFPPYYFHTDFTRYIYAVFKVFIMMKGDIDYETIFNGRQTGIFRSKEFSAPAHVIFAAFVIMVTLLLTSLLIGLAVNDIEEIQKQAKVNRSIRLINEIVIFESLIRNPILSCGISKFLCKYFSINRFKDIRGYSISFSPVNPADYTLPQNIKEMFIPYLSTCSCQQSEFLMVMKSQKLQ